MSGRGRLQGGVPSLDSDSMEIVCRLARAWVGPPPAPPWKRGGEDPPVRAPTVRGRPSPLLPPCPRGGRGGSERPHMITSTEQLRLSPAAGADQRAFLRAALALAGGIIPPLGSVPGF